MKKTLLFLFGLFIFTQIQAYDLVVAKDGSGNYTTIQAAVNAVPANRVSPFHIFIKNGKYKEQVLINNKFIHLEGESVAGTIITWDDHRGKRTYCNFLKNHLHYTASIRILADDFLASNITFENTTPDNDEGAAVYVGALRSAFRNCRMLGNQGTLLFQSCERNYQVPSCTNTGLTYFKSCYIEGTKDFIIGRSMAFFDSCVVYAKARDVAGNSYITAPYTAAAQQFGMVFRDARLPDNGGPTKYFLGHPIPVVLWEDVTRSKVFFMSSRMASHILPQGWSVFNNNTITANVDFSEYNSLHFNDAPVDVSQRVPWSYQRTATVATNTVNAVFSVWSPVSFPYYSGAAPADIAVSNFRLSRQTSSTLLRWNISWPLTGITYQLFRSVDNNPFTQVYSVTAINDTLVSFSYNDLNMPPFNSTYRYYVVASKSGYTSHTTDTISLKNYGRLYSNFGDSVLYCPVQEQTYEPIRPASFTISGDSLHGNVTVSIKSPFELSLDSFNWQSNNPMLTLASVNGMLPVTRIFVRIHTGVDSWASFSDTIHVSSPQSDSLKLPILAWVRPHYGGSPIATWYLDSDYWPGDSWIGDRTIALKNLVVADGFNQVPAFSSQYGQALARTGSGTWLGDTSLRHNVYEEFKLTFQNGCSALIDSLTFLAAGYNGPAKMSIRVSRDNFINDSMELYDGLLSGSPLTTVPDGTGFTHAFKIFQNDNGPSPQFNRYSFALNSHMGYPPTGPLVSARVYIAHLNDVGQAYVLLKNFSFVGKGGCILPVQLTDFYGENKENVRLFWKTAQEIDISQYIIERSFDGQEFEKIGSVSAKLSTTGNSYDFTDPDKLLRKTFYRLKIMHRDGKYEYSKVIVMKPSSKQLYIHPNPATDQITVSHSKITGSGQAKIFSTDGKLVFIMKLIPGRQESVIPVTDLPGGILSSPGKYR